MKNQLHMSTLKYLSNHKYIVEFTLNNTVNIKTLKKAIEKGVKKSITISEINLYFEKTPEELNHGYVTFTI